MGILDNYNRMVQFLGPKNIPSCQYLHPVNQSSISGNHYHQIAPPHFALKEVGESHSLMPNVLLMRNAERSEQFLLLPSHTHVGP